MSLSPSTMPRLTSLGHELDLFGWFHDSRSLLDDPAALRDRFAEDGYLFLTHVLIFSLQTLHASLDNTSNRVRLSTDSRYQPADEPADPRWIGPNPTGHSQASRRSLIC